MKRYEELLLLKYINGFGKVEVNKRRNLIRMCENQDELICKLFEQGISEEIINFAKAKAKREAEEIFADESIKIITIFDMDYPLQLKILGNKAPVVLYTKGNTELLHGKSISIIGTRNPSAWTEKVETKIVENIINDTKATIVSGLALGCDRIGHITALNCKGNTVAVLPSGFKNIAPSSNSKLAYEIIENGGCLITEYMPGEIPQKYTYLERDCIVAALSKALLIMECDENSGTMHTANEGRKLNKRIACYMPEDINKGNYAGNMKLINEGCDRIDGSESLQKLIEFLNKDSEEIVEESISLFEI